jgi:solute carrier family 41
LPIFAVLDTVQHWPVFVEISEIFILVPALLGLKGNLEMTLASRLSTAANLGKMDGRPAAAALILGNLALVQCQAIVVGLLASLTGLLMGWAPTGHLNPAHGLLLCASAVVTASLASFALGLVMVAVILFSRRFSINPDNVATPIAASLGDLTTLALLAWSASLLWSDLERERWLAPLIITFYILFFTPVCVFIAFRCADTRPILSSGWSPVLLAMLVSSGGGLILDYAVTVYPGIAVFQPVMNGVGGNLVAVQASRMSTQLHASAGGQGPGKLAADEPVCVSPLYVVYNGDRHSRTACVLLALVVPGHLIFCYTISYLEAGHTAPSPTFLALYLVAGWLQVALLLYVCRVTVFWMWSRGTDPDNSAIPYLTALGDLLGGAFLGLAFLLLALLGATEFEGSDLLSTPVAATSDSLNVTQLTT